MTIFAAAGSKVFIGTNPIEAKSTDFVKSNFTSVTWLEIDPLETIGVIGDQAQEITFASHSNQRETTLKGTRKAQNLELSAGLNLENVGQAKLLEAETTEHNFPFKIVFNDAPATGTAPKPSERYMIGLVMNATEEVNDANSVLMLNASVAVNSNIVRVNATSGA